MSRCWSTEPNSGPRTSTQQNNSRYWSAVPFDSHAALMAVISSNDRSVLFLFCCGTADILSFVIVSSWINIQTQQSIFSNIFEFFRKLQSHKQNIKINPTWHLQLIFVAFLSWDNSDVTPTHPADRQNLVSPHLSWPFSQGGFWITSNYSTTSHSVTPPVT